MFLQTGLAVSGINGPVPEAKGPKETERSTRLSTLQLSGVLFHGEEGSFHKSPAENRTSPDVSQPYSLPTSPLDSCPFEGIDHRNQWHIR